MSTTLLRAIPLTEQVAEAIRNRILNGELKPGERLVEQQLARNLGVGQNAVREALIDLSHRGFVKRVTNKGTYVTHLTLQDAHKLAEVRAALEGLAVELAGLRVRNGESLDLASIEYELHRMLVAAEAGDREAFYDADLKFHRILWSLSGNEFLSAMAEQVVVPLFAFFIMLYMRTGDAKKTLVEAVEPHAEVLRQIRKGDGAGGVRALHQLVDLSLKHQQGLIAHTCG